ncbi:hypothetical protein [Streptomyces hyaluromycini]|uniref:hypothetical protein n=1 Tax=Streptomyces hyaluromycini TaxID=1377993 RepID=UPI0012383BE0|nr:hypothetical protein [Streptomyces hyaluromycini]
MGRRGGALPGLSAVGIGLALLTGCGAPGGAERAAASSATPSATSAAELCATIVAHWSREVLDSGTYGDYQSMGLSNGQYEILRDVVDAARAVKRSQGAAAADRLIDRRSHAACTERYRHGVPTGGPWR